MKESKEPDLGTGSVGKLILKLSIPTVTAQIVNVLYNMVDRIYIGHIPEVGQLAYTGVGVCLSLIVFISAFASLVAMGGATRASILMGRGDKETAETILGNAVAGVAGISVALMAVFLIFGRKMLLLFGASENTIDYAVSYMRTYTFGTLFVEISLGLNAFITAQGFTRVSMLSVVIGAVCNIILDPIFIFGLDMGVQGAALATVLSQGVSAAWVLRFLTGKTTALRIQKRYLRIRPKVYLPCLALGLSPFIMMSTESVLNICFNSSLLKYGGDVAVGAMTTLASVMQFAMLPLQGLTQGTQPIISYNYGAGNGQRVKAAFKVLLICCLTYSALLWAAVMAAPQAFAGLFCPDPALMSYTVWALRIYMAVTLVFGAQIACQQTFIALGDAKTSLFLAVLRKMILLIPLIYILPAILDRKDFAVFLAEPVADMIAVTTTVSVFTVKFRKTMKEMEQKA